MRPANSLRGCSTSKPLIVALRFGTGRGSLAQCAGASKSLTNIRETLSQPALLIFLEGQTREEMRVVWRGRERDPRTDPAASAVMAPSPRAVF